VLEDCWHVLQSSEESKANISNNTFEYIKLSVTVFEFLMPLLEQHR